MVKKLNKRLVKQTLRGYQLVNKITEVERRVWLEHMSIEEARKIFDELHQGADDWKKDGGDLEAVERQRINSKVQGRQPYIRLAKQQGLL